MQFGSVLNFFLLIRKPQINSSILVLLISINMNTWEKRSSHLKKSRSLIKKKQHGTNDIDQ